MIITKLYVCGHCGNAVDEYGRPLTIEEIESIEDVNNPTPVHGYCCSDEDNQTSPKQVTREMALDAGMPELEGMWIEW